MYCSQCGKELPDNSKFCQQCGSPVSGVFTAHHKKDISINGSVSKPKAKRGITYGVIAICLLVVILLFVRCSPNKKEKPIEEHLLGEWIAENDNGESSIIFEFEDDEYVGEWTIYDYKNKEWEEIDFTIKKIDNHIMTILLDNGDVEYIPFAVSKDTLFFSDVEHKNRSKDVPIPIDEFAYIKDGVICPVTYGCYMGMSKREIDRVLAPLDVVHYNTGSYCVLSEEYGGITMSFNFDDDYGLDEISYDIDEYYDNRYDIAEYLSEIYGEYEREQWATSDNYFSWTWYSGNMVVRLNENVERKSLWIDYTIDLDWVIDYAVSNKE